METRVYWRFDLPEDVQRRTITAGWAMNDLVSINLLEVMAMVMTAYVMVDMREERPVRKREPVLMRPDNEVAVAWVERGWRWGEMHARVGILMRMMGALECRRG